MTTGQLAPNTPVTVKVGLDLPTPATDSLPWTARLDPVLGRQPVVLAGVGVAALALAALGALLSRSTVEKPPPYPLMYAPPEGIGPAQAAYMLTEKVEDRPSSPR